jgi:hypothetical protein
MRAITDWGRRIAIGLVVAFTVSTVNFPVPAVTAASPQPAGPGRVVIDQPDPPTVDVAAPALPAGAPLKLAQKQIPRPVGLGASPRANHVSKLASANVASLQAKGFAVLDNTDGRLLLQSAVGGKVQQFVIVDAKLRSGKEVIGFGAVQPATQASASLFGKTAEALYQGFAWCSYAWMSSPYDDLHIHLCARDAPYVLAIVATIAAVVGTVVAALIAVVVGSACGEICSPILYIAVVSIFAIATAAWFWLHTDAYGNVDVVIPNWTMQQPYGGYVLWANSGRWDYMYNQCWILEDRWYDRYC